MSLHLLLILILLLSTHVHGQSMGTKTVSESTSIQGVANTIIFTLRPSTALSAGDVVTILGLTGTQTANTGTLTVAGTDAAVFGSAGAWTQSSGQMVLTVAGGQTVPNNANTVVTLTIANKNEAQVSFFNFYFLFLLGYNSTLLIKVSSSASCDR